MSKFGRAASATHPTPDAHQVPGWRAAVGRSARCTIFASRAGQT
jgi:hypothetical protein